jgi:hypothetical protein
MQNPGAVPHKSFRESLRRDLVSNLMEAGVEFEAVDFPQANKLTIHILAG